MNKFSHSLIALPLLAAALLTGCGGGTGASAVPAPQAAPSIAVGEPSPNGKLDTTEFVAMARAAVCTDVRNRLFVIDEKQVMWDRAGNCPDNGTTQALFGSSAKTALCQVADSIAGPRTTCSDDSVRDQFSTMLKNLDKADLGLGGNHTVRAVSFLPANGSLFALETVASGAYAGVTAAQNVVIKDKAAWTRLWNDTYKNTAPAPSVPDIDFDKQMVIGVYLGEMPNGCRNARVTKVAVAADKLVVNYSEHDDLRAVMCSQALSSPFHLVAVNRSDATVEFANITANKLYFEQMAMPTFGYSMPRENQVIRDEASWNALWALVTSPVTVVGAPLPPAEKAPFVDFNKYMVVGVFLGNMSNGCYGTEIVNVDRSGGTINVTHRDRVPGRMSVCTQAIVPVAHMVLIERSDLKVEFTSDQVAL